MFPVIKVGGSEAADAADAAAAQAGAFSTVWITILHGC